MSIIFQSGINRRYGVYQQHGFSMLEVLVTVLVLSFGLLGMAGLVTTGMRANNIAHYRSIATQQTMDIADRMRANLEGASAVSGTSAYDSLDDSIPAVGTDCKTANCTAAEMAVYDHAQWNTANTALLPDGKGTVTGTLATGYVINIMWIEKEMGTNNDPACAGIVPLPPAATRCFITRVTL